MVRRGGYRNSAQKAGRSLGQKKRRMARERKTRNMEQGVRRISVDAAICETCGRWDTDELATYGIYKDDGEWILTAMAIKRTREKMVSDRQGGVQSETVYKGVVMPFRGELSPEDGLKLGTFDTKKAAMREVHADTSERIDGGRYVVRPGDGGFHTQRVDTDDLSDFRSSRNTYRL